MGDRAAKEALFAEFAAVGKVFGHPKRLELVDLLAQGPRSVEELAVASGLGMSTCSAHLQALREAGLVSTRRAGKRVFYSLAGDDVAALWDSLRRVAQQHRPHTEPARQAYLGRDDTDSITAEDVVERLGSPDIVLVDVRPEAEFAAGHLPGARNIPLDQLADRLSELPHDTEIVAYCRGEYCVLAYDAVRLLAANGFRASRVDEGILEWRLAGRPMDIGAA